MGAGRSAEERRREIAGRPFAGSPPRRVAAYNGERLLEVRRGDAKNLEGLPWT